MPILKNRMNALFLLTIIVMPQVFINRKVMLILGPLTFLVLVSSCHQHCWQRSFMSNKLPLGSNNLIFSWVFLC